MKIRFTVVIMLLSLFCVILSISGCSDQPNNPVLESETVADLDQYRSRQDEIALVDLGTLSQFVQEITISNPNISDRELQAQLFNKLVEAKGLQKNENHIAAGPSIPGYSQSLTWDEFWLLFYNPWYITRTNQASTDAINEAIRRWPGYSLVDDKADAFRHAYWNILLAKRIALWWARAFTTAHESESSGLPKYMDLHNNGVGREIYLWNQSRSERDLSNKVKEFTYKRTYNVSQIQETRMDALVYIK